VTVVRLVTVTCAKDLDAGVAFFRDRALPELCRAEGFLGAVLAVDRDTCGIVVATVWESAASQAGNAAAMPIAPVELVELFGGGVRFGQLEVAAVCGRGALKGAASHLAVSRLRVDPAELPSALAAVEVVGDATVLADPESGRIVVLAGVDDRSRVPEGARYEVLVSVG
jgi:hypothetical protein